MISISRFFSLLAVKNSSTIDLLLFFAISHYVVSGSNKSSVTLLSNRSCGEISYSHQIVIYANLVVQLSSSGLHESIIAMYSVPVDLVHDKLCTFVHIIDNIIASRLSKLVSDNCLQSEMLYLMLYRIT